MSSPTTYDRFLSALDHLNEAVILLGQVNRSPIDLGLDTFKEIYESINILNEQHSLLEGLFGTIEPLLEAEEEDSE